MEIQEGKRYIFKKSYTCDQGTIGEGREINYFRNSLLMDGLLIPQPFCYELKKLLENDNFVKEYIKVKDFSDSSYVI